MIHLITGGTRSGKSRYCEQLLKDKKSILYIATSVVTDEEMEERIQLHQQRRGSRYKTYEGSFDLDQVIGKAKEEAIMFECIGTWITNLIFNEYEDVENVSRQEILKLEGKIMEQVEGLLDGLKGKDAYIITNEVGLGLISEYKLGRIFTDILGRVNQKIAKEADQVTFMVSGLSLQLK